MQMEKDLVPLKPRIPVSTYRLQFNHNFGFSDAAKMARYFHELGITDIYASPYFRAKKGSLHGYDIVDHNMLNPEVGTEEQYNGMIAELRKYGIGQILDIVPNHMSIGTENPWWLDVLENGRAAIHAKYFDIDWYPAGEGLKDKLLIPILADQYGKILEAQELRLAFEEGAFFVYYFENKLPVQPYSYLRILQHRIEEIQSRLPVDDPHLVELLSIITSVKHLPHHTETETERVAERYREKEIIKKRLLKLYHASREIREFIDEEVKIFNGTKGDPKSFDLFDGLLNEQAWRLSYWRVASEEINYRRFFDINEMAALNMADTEVFAETHRLLFRLIAEGKVTGLRVDHPDGLHNPPEYFRRLQQACFVELHHALAAAQAEGAAAHSESEPNIVKLYEELLEQNSQYKPFYIVGEKILSKGERMPEDWQVSGTTGYAFMNYLNGIFVDTRNAKVFDQIYSRYVKEMINFADVVPEKKKLVMQVAMSGELHTLGLYLCHMAGKNRHTKDFTLNSLTLALMEIVAFFPVYRTYINALSVSDKDRQYIEAAVSKAKRKNPAMSASIYDFIKTVLLQKFPDEFSDEDRREWLEFTMRFQQYSAPVMAKGVEDTAFFVYNRMVSLNEVGGIPDRFGTTIEAFHGQNVERAKNWPHTLNATSTHDSKRSGDVRARINVLSEMPSKWRECLIRWSLLNKKSKQTIEGQLAPDCNEEYLLYQTLLGTWPIEIKDQSDYDDFRQRIKEYMLKAVREAKVNTSWISPNIAYEEAVMAFIDAVLADSKVNKFLHEFRSFQKIISHYGMYNSLAQVLLKIASPGVPDLYQGNELWNFSLVDPDNRRPVDYDIRAKMLDELKSREASDGPLKLAQQLIDERENGKIKLYVTYKGLHYRREKREFFENGEYVPLEVRGPRSHNVCTFGRLSDAEKVIVATPRFLTEMIQVMETKPVGEVWAGSYMIIPFAEEGDEYMNIFTGENLVIKKLDGANGLDLSDMFRNFPLALLSKK